jgi:hypothetical protein
MLKKAIQQYKPCVNHPFRHCVIREPHTQTTPCFNFPSTSRHDQEVEGRASRHLRSFTTETASELNVLGLDGDTLGVDGAEIGIFEERDKVGLD